MKKLFLRLSLSILSVIFLSTNGLAATAEPITSIRCNEFTFDATSSHDPDNENVTYFWDFGDGASSTDAVVDHKYTKSGDYSVTLSIADNTGLECSTSQTVQKVRANIPPTIVIKGINENICANETLQLDASGSVADGSQALSFAWTFGDGSTETGTAKVSKSYPKGGSYKLQLVVDDQSDTVCSVRTEEHVINVNEPPVAEAGEEELLVCVNSDADMTVNFDAIGSTDGNKDQLTYMWDFGDGNKKSGPKVKYQFKDLGNYDIKLIVADTSKLSCSSSVDFVRVKLNKAPKADAGEDILACPDEMIDFDGSNSYSAIKGTLDGQWVFGDGNGATGLKVSHNYNKAGRYLARLTVENQLNPMCPSSSDTKTVTINARPIVQVKNPEAVCLGATVNFDASTSSDPDGDQLEYYWSFGDGTILRSGSRVTHEYKKGGVYKVSVIADDGRETGCSTTTGNTQVKVNTPPVANAGPNLTCCVDHAASFDASASSDPDGDRLTYTWDFGDGTKTEGMAISHTYTKSGSYNVTLTVDDNSGTTCSTASSGFVSSANTAPVPIIKVR